MLLQSSVYQQDHRMNLTLALKVLTHANPSLELSTLNVLMFTKLVLLFIVIVTSTYKK
jgi:hypothetical protein